MLNSNLPLFAASLIAASPDDLASKGNNVWAMAADSDSAASYGPDWKTLVLMDRTTWDPTNSQLFPKTTKVRGVEGWVRVARLIKS